MNCMKGPCLEPLNHQSGLVGVVDVLVLVSSHPSCRDDELALVLADVLALIWTQAFHSFSSEPPGPLKSCCCSAGRS